MSFRSASSILWGALFAGVATFASVCVSGFLWLWHHTREARAELREDLERTRREFPGIDLEGVSDHGQLYDRKRSHLEREQQLVLAVALEAGAAEGVQPVVIDMRAGR